MIKIDIHKIEHQPNNRHLFETIILWKQIKINNAVISQPIQYQIIKLKKIKKAKAKKAYHIGG
jgi:hypothetical protein